MTSCKQSKKFCKHTKLIFLVFIMDISVAIYFLRRNEQIVQVPRRHLRDLSNVLDMPTKLFLKNLRVSKEIFVHILNELEGKWSPMHRCTQIRPDIKLSTFLLFLATGGYQQNVGNQNISSTGTSTVCRIIAECLHLFEEHICPNWINMPLPEEQDNIKEAFWEKYGFPGIIGCVDGTHIRIKSPGDDKKHLYYNRKGIYSINAMIVCDHKMKILCVEARYPGSNHDSFIWEHSAENRQLQREFDGGKTNTWLLGDGGYKLKPFLMTAFRNPRDAAEKCFNKKHISARNVVERCFGVLKNRFRCIIGSRGLHCSPKKTGQIVNACCALHNLCVEYNCPLDDIEMEDEIEESETYEGILEEMPEERAVAIRRRIAINL